MSSDYLLSNLGYDPDLNIKRLGDGLYEQRLIQQAVVARTGQRYIDGQTGDSRCWLERLICRKCDKGEDPTYSLLGTAVGTTIGFKGGPIISEQLKPLVGDTAASIFGNMAGVGISEVVGDEVKSLGDKK